MNPKPKKTIIILCIIGGAVIIVGVLAIILIPIIFRADYSEAYNIAKELDEKISKLSYNNDCDYVTSYYDSGYTSNKTFNGYIENCLAVTDGLGDLVDRLGQTSGIKRDSNLQNAYNGFKTAFDKLAIDSSSLSAKLDIYKTWHTFKVAEYDLDTNSTDSAYNTAGSILTESSNDTLKEYGAGWLELALAKAKTYKAYDTASYGSGYTEKRDAYYNAREALEKYIQEKEPDIEAMAPINMENSEAVVTRFEDLFRGIANTYAKHYNKGSGDCTEFLDEVYCPY